MSAGFVHLHVHTEYSALDGASRIGELLERCKEYGMRSLAITDHGVLFGALEFYNAAKQAGIKPIIGSELYVARGKNRFDKSAKSASASCHHLVLLCENETGYHNLCRLSTLGHTEGYHYRPRVDLELLAKYHEGLIASSACLAGEIPRCLMDNDMDAANAVVEKYVSIFGRDNFLIEMMDHGLPEEVRINPLLAKLAERHGLKLIATNDSHYTDASDAEAHEALLCIQTNNRLDDEKRFKFPGGPMYYFTSPEEMRKRFKEWPEAVSNTEKIADRCNYDFPADQRLIPEYVLPEGIDMSKRDYLNSLVMTGLEDRYDGSPSPAHLAQAEHEIRVIEEMDFVDYFLVVWDIMNYASNHSLPTGPGRGSGVGSIVAYALKITNIPPLRYGLLFDRFLTTERKSMPDFDLDFCPSDRAQLIEYVREKYGRDNVSQIITFGRMLAKNVVRNVARVLDLSFTEADRIAKLIPTDQPKITLDDALRQEPELKRLMKEDARIARLWRLATRLEGIVNHVSTHPAGVVVCDQPLTDHIPLFQAAGTDIVVSQFDMSGIDQMGLLKMDLLGLRNLTVIHKAVEYIRQNRGVTVEIDTLEPDDPKTYDLLRSGNTTGVFQLESSGMRDVAKRIGLESLEEVCALVALYRPGPMALKDQYIESKHHPERIKYDHPLLEPILKETYGVALYQEQVMRIAVAVAGFSLGQSEVFRRAMGKKKKELMDEQRERFCQGAIANGIEQATAELLFARIEQFAGYGFNKSHSMAYAFIAYQTAYLKANYPVEYMAALLTSDMSELKTVAKYVEECRRMGIEVLPPDINASTFHFTVEGEQIRFGMGAVKHVGEGPVEAIVANRDANGPFQDVFDLCSRIDTRQINRRVIESLNRAGAFSSTEWARSQVEAVLDAALGAGQASQRDREAGQASLLDLMEGGAAEMTHQKPDLPEWSEAELLASEREILGLYVSSHPLARHAQTLERFSTIRVAELPGLYENQEVVVGGLISTVKHHVTQAGKKMAFITLDTLEEPCEITVFADLYEQRAGLLVQDMIVMIPARVSVRNGENGLVATEIIDIEDTESRLTKAIHIRLTSVAVDEPLLERLAEIFDTSPGRCDVFLHCRTPEHDEVTVHATTACRVAPSKSLRHDVERLLGEDSLWFSGGNGLPSHNE